MIKLTRLNGKDLYTNPDLIENIEAYPDTVITMTNGNKVTVREKPDEIVARITAFRAGIIRKSNQPEG